MQTLIIIAVIGGVLWYVGVWPFDGSYPSLRRRAETGNKNTDGPPP